MILTFAEALKKLGPDAVLRLIRTVRPTSDYLLTGFLPEMLKSSYSVENGQMVIRATMAGMSGMDAPYAKGGVMTAKTFLEKTAKITNEVTLTETAIRELQEMMFRTQGTSTTNKIDLVREALNFEQKMIIQPHWDTNEFLIGQIFTTGKINWTYNKIKVEVDYGVPADHLLTNRTGNDAYDGSNSQFWADIRSIQKKLNRSVEAFLMHPDTFEVALDNSVNAIRVVEETEQKYGKQYRITKVVNTDTGLTSNDARDTVTIRTYGAEGELIDPSDPETTIKKPFLTAGKIVGIGRAQIRGYIPGEGSTDDESRDRTLGYTHIAPTTEGGGQIGRWARLYVPESKPMQLQGQGVGNVLPVVESPEKIAIASTDMPA